MNLKLKRAIHAPCTTSSERAWVNGVFCVCVTSQSWRWFMHRKLQIFLSVALGAALLVAPSLGNIGSDNSYDSAFAAKGGNGKGNGGQNGNGNGKSANSDASGASDTGGAGNNGKGKGNGKSASAGLTASGK